MPNQNLYNLISEALKILNKRSQDVIIRRFGLRAGDKETLESIGKSYKITRERVRQIEEAALRDLRKNFLKFNIGPELALVSKILEDHGNVLREEILFEKYSGTPKLTKENAALVLAMLVSSQFERHPETDELYTFWSSKNPVYAQNAKAFVSQAVSYLNKSKKLLAEDEFVSEAAKFIKNGDSNPQVILSYISISKEIGKNKFDQWGLAKWPEISPRGVKDKAYLILDNHGKPAHFREITEMINTNAFDVRKANPQTVHNELIKDPRFVLVGRGLYALAEWGFPKGTVKEVLIDILKKHGKPLPKDKLFAEVLSTRFVKPNTILLNLQDSKTFRKDESGRYTLAQ